MADQESPLSPTPTQPDTPRLLTGEEIMSSFSMIVDALKLQSASINSNKETQYTGKPLNINRKCQNEWKERKRVHT